MSYEVLKYRNFTLYLNASFVSDLKRKYKTWNEWSLCEGENTACYATGTKTRERVCISESVHQSNVNHCVGPATQKGWCEMPCKGKKIIYRYRYRNIDS